VFVEGGVYHVYNRFASGEPVFADPEEAKAFVDLFRRVKARDGWTLFAWCLMSNHYHFALRSRAVPIWHGLQHLQGRFSQRFNRGRGRTGALWQSRYQAKLVDEQAYLDRLILYIHLNPVRAGVVSEPVDHVFCGHREIVKRVSNPVIDVDEALLSFGQTERAARRAYLSGMRAGCVDAGSRASSASIREWLWLKPDRDLERDDSAPYIDELGRSTGRERPQISAEEFVAECSSVLDVDVKELASRSRREGVVDARRLVVTLGRERWGQRTKDLAGALGKSADVATYLIGEGGKRRLTDPAFAERIEALDAELCSRFSLPCGRSQAE
jgi:putative transposase